MNTVFGESAVPAPIIIQPLLLPTSTILEVRFNYRYLIAFVNPPSPEIFLALSSPGKGYNCTPDILFLIPRPIFNI